MEITATARLPLAADEDLPTPLALFAVAPNKFSFVSLVAACNALPLLGVRLGVLMAPLAALPPADLLADRGGFALREALIIVCLDGVIADLLPLLFFNGVENCCCAAGTASVVVLVAMIALTGRFGFGRTRLPLRLASGLRTSTSLAPPDKLIVADVD